MARYSISDYRRLVESLRRTGGNIQESARETGIDWRRVRTVYNEGWPATKTTPIFRPIKDVIAEIKAAEPPPAPIPPELMPPVELRPDLEPPPEGPPPDPTKLPPPQTPAVNPATPTAALKVTGQLLSPGELLDREMYLEPDELQKYAVKSLRSTLKGIDIALSGVTGIAASATRLVGAMQPLLEQVKKDLELQAKAENVGPGAFANAAKDLAALNGALNGAAKAMKDLGEARNLALGQPTSIMGLITPPPVKTTTVEPDQQTENNKLLQALFAMGADPDKAAPVERDYVPETGSAESTEEEEETTE
jgi:hypothetical protein